ncbi:CPBP family intramembrane glutamic endopeptidase [Halomonas denitrificans]|nr:CPBP family intramembrane metalloprotease [Halomonas denitrificans]
MLGALILLLLNLLVLRLAGAGPRALGIDAPVRRLLEFTAGVLLAAGFAALQLLVLAGLAGFDWVLRPGYGVSDLLGGLRWNVVSVLFEELIFRGALLWLAIRWLGPVRACLLSAAAFGVYHWFSYGLFGDLVTMAYVFVLTGTFGLMLAAAFAWSRSLVLPIALHLGWNLVNNEVFSKGPMGERWLTASVEDAARLGGLEQVLVSIVIPLSMPLLVLLVLNRLPQDGPRSGRIEQ